MKGSSIAYILILVLLVGVLVYFSANAPKPVSWDRNLDPVSSQPYGLEAMETLIGDLFPNQPVTRNRNSIFLALENQELNDANILSLSNFFNSDAAEGEALLDYVKEGHDALIVADDFDSEFLDLLGLQVVDDGILARPVKLTDGKWEGDSIRISWVTGDSTHFYYPKYLFGYAFEIENYNAARNLEEGPMSENRNRIKPLPEELDWEYLRKEFGYEVIACNEEGNPVVLKISHGTGHLLLCSAPMSFTNYFILKTDNHPFASATLGLLPADNSVAWSEYYQQGREESTSPLRVIASNPNLKFAWWLMWGIGLLFMIFKGKRKQRVIPVITPPRNDTLDFVSTVGNLYHERGDHTDLAKKKVTFWQEYIRSHYFMDARELNEDFAKKLAAKTSKDESDTIRLVKMAHSVQQRPSISEAELRVFNKHLEKFYA